jgi:succinyldiaminopimelate transaminase
MQFHVPNLPDFPWDTIAEDDALARSHPEGICDLSVGTPPDPTPDIARATLAVAANAHGYPAVWGTPALRESILAYLTFRWKAVPLQERNVAPIIGAKEFIAWLPTMAGIGEGDTVVVPEVAYPTYAVGADMVGASVVRARTPDDVRDESPVLVWINSPSNPSGHIDTLEEVKAWVDYARDKGALLASDECYGEFGWDGEPISVLDGRVNGGSVESLLGVFSLSKRSNLAGYRAGFVAGDSEIVMALVGLRKHLGMMVPTPVQETMAVLLSDQEHVEIQRERYESRRRYLSDALVKAGFTIDDSQGGLYLWATRGEDGRATTRWFAERGILVAPGDFYGEAGREHVRVALTAIDERIMAAAARIVEGVTEAPEVPEAAESSAPVEDLAPDADVPAPPAEIDLRVEEPETAEGADGLSEEAPSQEEETSASR